MTSTDTVPAETLHRWQLRGQKLIHTLLTDARKLDLFRALFVGTTAGGSLSPPARSSRAGT